jgi:transposase-like protein
MSGKHEWVDGASETFSSEGPQCPYCGHTQRADEPGFYADDYEHDTCPKCGKEYEVSVYSTTNWTCSPIEGAEQDLLTIRKGTP